MRSLNGRDLNPFSVEFARALFSKYPSWREFSKIDSSNYSTNFLVVEVPAPAESKADFPLIIDTEGDEVTVGFDRYHSHFNWPPFDEVHQNPLVFIDDIVQERVAIASLWGDSRWLGSQTLAPPERTEGILRKSRAEVLRIRSWNGRFNADRPVDNRVGNSDDTDDRN
ncbi:MAG TPA: hypothetical protein VGH02_03590 [Rhizomicrobium sp.]|jgi:hypothetical protein